MKKLFLILILPPFLLFQGCNNTDVIVNPPAITTQGVYILNEGGFGQNNSEITFYDIKAKTAQQNVFSGANSSAVLGDVGNDIVVFNGRGYVIVSQSNKIEVVSLKDFTRIATIDLGANAAPRHIEIASATDAFVTGFSDKIFHIDLASNTVKATITAGSKPEGIAVADGKLFVANSGLGFGYEVDVFSLATKTKIKTIQVGINPTSVVKGADGNIYVNCRGLYDAAARGVIYRIRPSDATATDSVVVTGNPSDLTLFKGNDALVLVNDGIARINLATMTVVTPTFISGAAVNPIFAMPYALGYDAVEDRLYVGNPKDFVQNGEVVVYDGNGTEIKRFPAGINPAVIKVARF